MNMNQREIARIEFAGKAMQGLLANRVYTEYQARKAKTNQDFVKVIAADSVEMADALIAELERTEVRHD